MSEIVMRRATATDAAALAELAAETFPLACQPNTPAEAIAAYIDEELTVARFEEHLDDAARVLFVAEESGGRLVGYTMLITGEPGDPDAAAVVVARPAVELSKVYTRGAVHGTGVAQASGSRSGAGWRRTGCSSARSSRDDCHRRYL
ncbi:GNAT family N-acetyltransferase [Agromyces sp. H66]|uniref:GNAT family N-acetyltransferase n=1 Tax=Agromyces sp. H66 TaxID=2529859 RepID=UPI0020C177A7|nr:GNAT family N-acetyltransferase [Agromyces sp. H66]